jgi:hypothetical protein
VRIERAEHFAAHRDERRRAAGRGVEPLEKLLARRFDAALQPDEVFLRRLVVISRIRALQLGGIGRELRRKRVEKRRQGVFGKAVVRGERVARDRRAGHFAALGQQRLEKLHREPCATVRAAALARDDRTDQALQERRCIHEIRTQSGNDAPWRACDRACFRRRTA